MAAATWWCGMENRLPSCRSSLRRTASTSIPPRSTWPASPRPSVAADCKTRSSAPPQILTGGLTKDPLLVNWGEVRYQHVTAMRSVLIESGAAPATTNHILAAVRGTLREAWRLELIDAETLARAIDVKNVTATTLPAGRHVDVGEVAALFRACGTELGRLQRCRNALASVRLWPCGVVRGRGATDRRLRPGQGHRARWQGPERPYRLCAARRPRGHRRLVCGSRILARRPSGACCEGRPNTGAGHDRPGGAAAPSIPRQTCGRPEVHPARPAAQLCGRVARRGGGPQFGSTARWARKPRGNDEIRSSR